MDEQNRKRPPVRSIPLLGLAIGNLARVLHLDVGHEMESTPTPSAKPVRRKSTATLARQGALAEWLRSGPQSVALIFGYVA